jgi:hypothetical protein
MRPAPFGQTGHGALEGMRMAVGGRGDQNPCGLRIGGTDVCSDTGDSPVGPDLDRDPVVPTIGQKRLFGPELTHATNRLDVYYVQT